MGLSEVLWLINLNYIASSSSNVDFPTLGNPYNLSQVVTFLIFLLIGPRGGMKPFSESFAFFNFDNMAPFLRVFAGILESKLPNISTL